MESDKFTVDRSFLSFSWPTQIDGNALQVVSKIHQLLAEYLLWALFEGSDHLVQMDSLISLLLHVLLVDMIT